VHFVLFRQAQHIAFVFKKGYPVTNGRAKISRQATGGAQRLFLTVAIFRSWRGSKGFAAPGLPGRWQAYLM